MKPSVVLPVLLFSASLAPSVAWAQHRAGYTPHSAQSQVDAAKPSGGAQTEFEIARAQVNQRAVSPVQRLQEADLAKLRSDADELAMLAQSIPVDVDQTTRGILPKDLDQRLKKIQKLAKQLRSRISH
jgi:type II secretory pathway component GspD/PulD (secretin)